MSRVKDARQKADSEYSGCGDARQKAYSECGKVIYRVMTIRRVSTFSVLVLVVAMILATILNTSNDSSCPLDFLKWIHWAFMTPFMLILYGFALFVSGKAYQFKPLVIGAFICWAFTAAIFSMFKTEYFMELQLVALIVSVVSGFIIPGHLLNKKEKSHV